MGTMETVTKKKIAVEVSEQLGFSLRESIRLVDAFFGSIKAYLMKGSEVKLVRFGVFLPVERACKFKEGTKRTVAFHPSRGFKGRLNGQEEALQD